MTTKRPDVIERNKSVRQGKLVSLSWKDPLIREIRIAKLKLAMVGKKPTYGHLGKKHSTVTKRKIGLKTIERNYKAERHPNWKGGFPKCIDCKKQLKNRYAKRCRCCSMKEEWKTRKKNGWKFSDSSKQKIRKNVIKHLKDNSLKQDTSIELKIKEVLEENNIQYEHPFKFNDKFLCDFAIVDKKIIVECDGDYWHNREDIKKRDRSKNAYIRKCGWEILRFWEKDINNNINMCKNKIIKCASNFHD